MLITGVSQTLPAWVEVDLDALAHNIAVVRRLVGPRTRILLIVKADAYGHGAVEIAREAVRGGVYMLGVATVDEGRKQKENPLLAVLKERVLPDKETAEPLAGLLYFSLEGKHKPKQLALQYAGTAGKLILEFK